MKRLAFLLFLLVIGFAAARVAYRLSARHLVTAGDAYARRGEWSAAAIEYRNAMKRQPALIDAHIKLADASERLGDAQTVARERLWVALAKPAEVDAQLSAGQACLAAGRIEDAEARLQRAVGLAPEQGASNRAIAEFYMRVDREGNAEPYWQKVSKLPPSAGGDPYALADFYVAAGRFDEAMRELVALADGPDSDAAQMRLARVLYARGQQREADQALDAVLSFDGRNESAWMLRGQFHLASRPDAALAAFTKALDINPTSIDALTGLTWVDLTSGRAREAVSRIETYLARMPDDPAMLKLAGRTFASAGIPDRAEQAFARAIRVNGKDAEAPSLLGRLYLREGRADAALAQFELAARLQPNAVAANTIVAMLLQRTNHNAEAQKKYEDILAVNPRAAVAANNLAWMYLDEGRLDEALQYAQVAKDELGRTPQVNDTLGWIDALRDQPLDAIPLLARAVDADPSNPAYRYHLGIAYSKAEREASARSELDRAVSLSKSFPGRDDALRALAQIDAAAAARRPLPRIAPTRGFRPSV